MNPSFWGTKRDDNSQGWHGQIRLGRLQLGYHVYQHRYPTVDRWVVQPWVMYDRKRVHASSRMGAK